MHGPELLTPELWFIPLTHTHLVISASCLSGHTVLPHPDQRNKTHHVKPNSGLYRWHTHILLLVQVVCQGTLLYHTSDQRNKTHHVKPNSGLYRWHTNILLLVQVVCQGTLLYHTLINTIKPITSSRSQLVVNGKLATATLCKDELLLNSWPLQSSAASSSGTQHPVQVLSIKVQSPSGNYSDFLFSNTLYGCVLVCGCMCMCVVVCACACGYGYVCGCVCMCVDGMDGYVWFW